MTDAIAPSLAFDWDAEGQRIGQTLDRAHAVVVVGTDSDATARVALAIGRAQSERRRAVVVDLLGDAAPVRALIPESDVHGVVDSFEYGVSLARITHPVPGQDRLLVVPTGTELPDYAAICPHPRWRRIVTKVRDSDGLLVVAIPSDAARLEDLVAATDGAVVVGEGAPPHLSPAFIIGLVRGPRDRRNIVHPEEREATRAGILPRGPATAGGVLLVALALLVFWLARRPYAGGEKPAVARLPTNETPTAHVLRSSVDSPRTGAPLDSVALSGGPVVTNPQDAAIAAKWAVELMAANTTAGAILKLQRDGRNLPAGTFSPLLIGEARWFKVYAGAFTVREDADALFDDLRRRGLLAPGASVVSVPFTLLIDHVPATAAAAMVATYADRGQPVYALRQDDGSAWLCIGAFPTPESAAPYAETLRASGINPELVYRKGRMF